MNTSSPIHGRNRFDVDTRWFRSLIEDRITTANAVADKLGWHRSEFSRKLNGRRPFTYEDCEALARLLRSSLQDVLAAANVKAHPAPPPAVLGRVDLSGVFTRVADGKKPKVRDQGSVEVPQPGMSRLMLVPVLVAAAFPEELKESLPGIAVLADGRALLRVIRTGARAGRYDLLPAFGLGERENDVEVLRVYWVAPTMLS